MHDCRTNQVVLIALLICGLLTGAEIAKGAEGPSFDCAKARRQDERAICKNLELSELDREAAVEYEKAKAAIGSVGANKIAKYYNTQRRNCGRHISCLKIIIGAAIESYRRNSAQPEATSGTPIVASPQLEPQVSEPSHSEDTVGQRAVLKIFDPDTFSTRLAKSLLISALLAVVLGGYWLDFSKSKFYQFTTSDLEKTSEITPFIVLTFIVLLPLTFVFLSLQ